MTNQNRSLTSPSSDLTRREALRHLLAGGLVAATLPAAIASSTPALAAVEREFVPENNYPCFGYEPEPMN